MALWHDPWLVPYLPHLGRLIAEATWRAEMVLFPLGAPTIHLQQQQLAAAAGERKGRRGSKRSKRAGESGADNTAAGAGAEAIQLASGDTVPLRPEHRAQLLPIVMRILVGKLFHRTHARAHSRVCRTAVVLPKLLV